MPKPNEEPNEPAQKDTAMINRDSQMYDDTYLLKSKVPINIDEFAIYNDKPHSAVRAVTIR